MPIPVSVTGWNKGAAETAESLDTAGPFARLAATAGAPAAEPALPQQADNVPKAALGANDAVCKVVGLSFYHCGLDGRPQPGAAAVLEDISFSLPRGARVLLLGSNGAGKSTLLRILAGKHMVGEGVVQVLGRDVFHDTDLTCDGELAFIGGQWQKDVAFAGHAVPLQGDFPASRMLDNVQCDPARRARILRALDVDVNWRMNKVSDGQRRRVQLAWGLMRPFTLLLLDEVTVDLDVLARAELMNFLTAECAERGATIVYATHIFDGLERWATHLALLAGGRLALTPTAEMPQLAKYNGRLFPFMHAWLREDQQRAAALPSAKKDTTTEILMNNGWGAGRSAPTVATR